MRFDGKFINDKGQEVDWWFEAPSQEALEKHLNDIGWKLLDWQKTSLAHIFLSLRQPVGNDAIKIMQFFGTAAYAFALISASILIFSKNHSSSYAIFSSFLIVFYILIGYGLREHQSRLAFLSLGLWFLCPAFQALISFVNAKGLLLPSHFGVETEYGVKLSLLFIFSRIPLGLRIIQIGLGFKK